MIELACGRENADEPPPAFVHVDSRKMEQRMVQLEKLVGALQAQVAAQQRGDPSASSAAGPTSSAGGGDDDAELLDTLHGQLSDTFEDEMKTSYYVRARPAVGGTRWLHIRRRQSPAEPSTLQVTP